MSEMLGFMAAGFMTVLCMFMMMARTDLKKWLGYGNWVDVGFTLVMIMMFHGSFAGVVSASCSGVFMSGMLWAGRNALGYKRCGFHWVKVRYGVRLPMYGWYDVPAKWSIFK